MEARPDNGPSFPAMAITTADPLFVIGPHTDFHKLAREGAKLLSNPTSKYIYGSQFYDMVESVVIAYLHLKQHAEAAKYCHILELAFPKSFRVRRLQGMMLEAKGDYQHALQWYESCLKEDPTYKPIHKRIVAVYKGQEKYKAAISKLVQYLDTFSSDIEGWIELANLYVEVKMIKQAAFCMEEVILRKPLCYSYHSRYAEILLMNDEAESSSVALAEYIRVSQLCKHNRRALLGILQCVGKLVPFCSKGKEVEGITFEQLQQVKEVTERKLEKLKMNETK